MDRDAEAVRLAQQRGVAGVHADFREYRADPFDAVLFTRSLHHVEDLEGAVEHARALLVSGGRLVADEFAREAADEASAAFFYGLRSVLEAAGLLSDDHATDDAEGDDALGRWRRARAGDHRLHEGAAMLAAVQGRFPAVEVERTAYLYRYLAQRVEPTARGGRVVSRLLDLETADDRCRHDPADRDPHPGAARALIPGGGGKALPHSLGEVAAPAAGGGRRAHAYRGRSPRERPEGTRAPSGPPGHLPQQVGKGRTMVAGARAVAAARRSREQALRAGRLGPAGRAPECSAWSAPTARASRR